MKLFAVHSPTFAAMWGPFEESVRKHTSFELVAEELPARFDGVYFGQERYIELLRWLVERRVRLAQIEKEVFVTAGVDSEFFGDPVPLVARLMLTRGLDLLGADDNPDGGHKLCSCFYAIKPGLDIIALFEKVLADPRFGYGPGKEPDDPILNQYRDMVQWACLPHNLFWNTLRLWKRGDPVPTPPSSVLWVHGNFCVGLENKLALLEGIRNRVGVKR